MPACHSLKEKRRRLKGLRDRFGKAPGMALSETAFHDRHDLAQWSLVAIGRDGGQVQAQLGKVEKYIHENIDGYVSKAELESLK